MPRRSTCRIALVEFGNSIRIAWVAGFSNCFPIIGPMPRSRYPIDIVKCGKCNLQLQRAESCTDISTHRWCPIADIRSSLNSGGATCSSCKLHRHFHASEIENAGVSGEGWGGGRYRYQRVVAPVLDPVLELEFELEFEFPDPPDGLECYKSQLRNAHLNQSQS